MTEAPRGPEFIPYRVDVARLRELPTGLFHREIGLGLRVHATHTTQPVIDVFSGFIKEYVPGGTDITTPIH